MPIYNVKDKNTGEITEMFISISEWEKFKVENPDKEPHFTSLHVADSISLGIRKPPKDFQEGVIGRIKKNNPGHNIQSRWD